MNLLVARLPAAILPRFIEDVLRVEGCKFLSIVLVGFKGLEGLDFAVGEFEFTYIVLVAEACWITVLKSDGVPLDLETLQVLNAMSGFICWAFDIGQDLEFSFTGDSDEGAGVGDTPVDGATGSCVKEVDGTFAEAPSEKLEGV